MLRTLLILILLIALVGSLPSWSYSASWGYFPSGGMGLLLGIASILIIMGVL